MITVIIDADIESDRTCAPRSYPTQDRQFRWRRVTKLEFLQAIAAGSSNAPTDRNSRMGVRQATGAGSSPGARSKPHDRPRGSRGGTDGQRPRSG